MPMSVSLWESICVGVRAIKQDRNALSSITVLTCAIMLIGVLTIGHIGVLAAHSLLHAAAEVRIDILPTASTQEVLQFSDAIQNLDGVEETIFLRRDQVVEEVKKRDPEVVEFLDTFDLQYPFNDVFVVKLNSFDAYTPLITFLEDASWATVLDPMYTAAIFAQQRQLYDVLHVIRTVRLFTSGLIVLSVVFLCIILLMWIGQEIRTWGDDVRTRLESLSFITVLLPIAIQHTILLWIACVGAAILIGIGFALTSVLLVHNTQSSLLLLTHTIQTMLLSRLPIMALLALVIMPLLSVASVSIVLKTMKRPLSPS